jgi:hypothetical protein
MLTAILWTLTACICGLIAGGSYTALMVFYDWTQVRLREATQLRELEGEVHVKALRAASREVE